MAAIKKFFEKKIREAKFKKAGKGHKLTEDTRGASAQTFDVPQSARSRSGPTSENQMAATAALDRLTTKDSRRPGTSGVNMSTMKAQMKAEMDAEKNARAKLYAQAELYSGPKEVEMDGAPMLAVAGVYFRCPIIGPEVLPKEEMEAHIESFLLAQLPEEPEMTSALMIHTLNKNPEKSRICMETMSKYLDNIINNPTEEKYRKIRANNKAFQERVVVLKGTQEFLQSIGFERKSLPGPNEVEEDFLVMDAERAADTERLKAMKEVLFASETIKPELDRSLRVYHPSQRGSRMEVPAEFYSISPEEIKKELQIRQEAVERLGMLRTKEMREREKQRELRRYRYCLIRVRFPDGILLQGTFKAHEKCSAVYEFVRENLNMEWIPFHLSAAGQKLSDESQTLAEASLAPAATLVFSYDQDVLKEMAAQQGGQQIKQHLNELCMSIIQEL